MMPRISILIFAVAICCSVAIAQVDKIINGGQLNEKAIDLPHPEYPDAARAARIGGIIGVNVVIDESGTVVSVASDPNDQRERRSPDGSKMDPVPADASLREAAEKAAWQARFSPTLLSGQPVKVKGKILYNFIVDNSDQPPRVGDIYGPLLNRSAVYLAQPNYPDAARSANIGGSVTVKIWIGEDGSVTYAEAVYGPQPLRRAAEEAARKSKFKPLTPKVDPLVTAGILTFDFQPK